MKEFLSLIKKWMTRLLAGIATVLLSIMTCLLYTSDAADD